MPTFDTYQDAMLATLGQVPGIASVDEFVGDVSAELLRKAAPRDAGLLLIALGGQPAAEQPDTGQLAWVARSGAFIVTRNARGSVARTRGARQLAQDVMLAIRNNQWGLPGVYGAEIERLENRSIGDVDKAGYGLWLVVWKQTLYLDEIPADTTPPITSVAVQTDGRTDQAIAA